MVALLVLTLGIGASTAIFRSSMPWFSAGCRSTSTTGSWRSGSARPREAAAAPTGRIAIPGASRAARRRTTSTGRPSSRCSSRWRPCRRRVHAAEPGAEPEDLVAQRVTAGFFDVLRVRPAIGRAFTAENEVDGRHRVGGAERCALASPFRRAIPKSSAGRFHSKTGRYESSASCRRTLRIPSGPCARRICGSLTLCPTTSGSEPGSFATYLQHRTAEAGRLGRAGAGADGSDGRRARESPTRRNKDNKAGVRPLRDHIVGARTKSWMLMLLGAVGSCC